MLKYKFKNHTHPESNTQIDKYKSKSKTAFTMAEVLITLGIIGVVAALTLPTLIHKQKNKALETSFKKAYSNLSNAYNLVIADEIPVFVRNPTESRPDGDVDSNSYFAREIYKQYRKIKKISASEKEKYKNSAKNYTLKSAALFPQCSQYMNGGNAFIAPDGSILSIMQNCGALWFTIDTNGLIKGPNALGHDIFIFVAEPNNQKLIPAYNESEVKIDENGNTSYNNTEETRDKCSLTSKSVINGTTCGVYALQNICPYDSNKTYWECLP